MAARPKPGPRGLDKSIRVRLGVLAPSWARVTFAHDLRAFASVTGAAQHEPRVSFVPGAALRIGLPRKALGSTPLPSSAGGCNNPSKATAGFGVPCYCAYVNYTSIRVDAMGSSRLRESIP